MLYTIRTFFTQDANGNTMLHVCAQNNSKKMANLCIKHGCDLNARNRKGMTPLDYCDMLKFSALAEWMVNMGAENGSLTRGPATADNFQSTRGMR
jgi:ankyrin repeat protein